MFNNGDIRGYIHGYALLEAHPGAETLGGTVPPKFEVGGRPMHPSPQYLEK